MPPPVRFDTQSLLKHLVGEATKRGDTLASLAKNLGITYRRLAQLRSNAASIKRVQRGTLERAARYLNWPVILVLVHADIVKVSDLQMCEKLGTSKRVELALKTMRNDAEIGPFFPRTLNADEETRLLLAFLFDRIQSARSVGSAQDWMKEVRLAVDSHL